MTDSRPSTTKGNNTTISSTSLKPESSTNSNNNNNNNNSNSDTPPRDRRKRHEQLRTSDEELKEFNKTYHAKEHSQYMDPCRAQTKASLKCMDENNYDKRRCTRFFKDYSDCKKQWMASLREDRRKKNLGIVDDDNDSTPTTQQDTTSTFTSASKPS